VEIESAGKIELSDKLRSAVEDALNDYILHRGWDRNSGPSKKKKDFVRSFRKHVHGLLHAMGDLERKLGDGFDFDAGVALETQCLFFFRAKIDCLQFIENLRSLDRALEDDGGHPAESGRPKDLFLSDFFRDLEDIYRAAGGRWVGVTKAVDGSHRRESPFADFVNAILRFDPAGIGPSSSLAVAVAWERQLRSRRAVVADNP
jgi:hypothetical protein